MITVGKIYLRHYLLEHTIGLLQMEIDAYQTAKWLFLCIPTVILLTLIQLGFFTLYNGWLHPMRKILDVGSTQETKEVDERSQSKYQIISWITQICSNKPDGSSKFYLISFIYFPEKLFGNRPFGSCT
jgi:hypothetical protein